MSAPALPLRRFPAFASLADALDSFHRMGWRPSQWSPPVDATGDEQVDVTLAAVFARLIRLESRTAQMQCLLLSAESNECHADRIASAAHAFGVEEELGWRRAADVHRRAAKVLRRWIDELADAADGEAA